MNDNFTTILRLSAIAIFVLIVATIVYLQLDGGFGPADNSLTVDVLSGSVQVVNGAGEISLTDGEKGIVDANGKPIANKKKVERTIAFVDDEYSRSPSLDHLIANATVSITDHVSGEIILTAQTDAQGRVTFNVPEEQQTWQIRVPGYFESGPQYSNYFLNRDEFTLIRERQSKVIVQDMEQSPLLDTLLVLNEYPSNAPVLSASGAEVVLSPLKPTEYKLTVLHPALLDDEIVILGGQDVTVQLSDRTTLLVNVETGDRKPVADAELDLMLIESGGFIPSGTAYTQADGSAQFPELKEGVYSLGCSHSWYTGQERYRVTIDQMRESYTITLPSPDKTIAGHVYDASTGEALEGIPVVCGLDIEPSRPGRYALTEIILPATRTIYTQPNGSFQFDKLWSGNYQLYVDRVDGYISGDFTRNRLGSDFKSSTNLKRVLLSDQEPYTTVDFHLLRPWVIRGTVYDPHGKPLPNQEVRGAHAQYAEYLGLLTHTDDKGQYKLTGLIDVPSMIYRDNRTFFLRVEHEIFGLARHKIMFSTDTPIDPASGYPAQGIPITPGEELEVDYYFEAQPVIAGTVKNIQGEPIPGANVHIFRDASNIFTEEVRSKPMEDTLAYYTTTGEQGEYTQIISNIVTVDKDSPMKFAVIASASGYKRSSRIEPHELVEVKQSTEPTVCNFTLLPGSNDTLRGIVVDMDGNPVEGVFLSLRGSFDVPYPYMQSNGVKTYLSQYFYFYHGDENSRTNTRYQKTGPDGMFSFDLSPYEPKLPEKFNNPEIVNELFERYSGNIKETLEKYPNAKIFTKDEYLKRFHSIRYQLDVNLHDHILLSGHSSARQVFKPLKPYTPGERYPAFMSLTTEDNDLRLVVERKDEAEASEFLTINGKVIDNRSAPIRQFELIVIPQSPPQDFSEAHPYYQWTPIFTQDGTFTINNLKKTQGPFVVAARNDIYAAAYSKQLPIPDLLGRLQSRMPVPDDAEVELTLGPGASVRGVLVDPQTNQPIPGLKVTCMLSMGVHTVSNVLQDSRGPSYSPHSSVEQILPEAITDENGSFYLLNVPVPGVFLRIPESQHYQEYITPARPLQYGESKFLGNIQMRPK